MLTYARTSWSKLNVGGTLRILIPIGSLAVPSHRYQLNDARAIPSELSTDDSSQLTKTLPPTWGDIKLMAFSSDGRSLAILSQRGSAAKVQVLDVRHGRFITGFSTSNLNTLSFVPSSRRLVVGGGNYARTSRRTELTTPNFEVWNVGGSKSKMVRKLVPAPSNPPTSVDFSLDGTIMLSCHGSGVYVWDALKWRQIRRINVINGTSFSVALARKASIMAVGSYNVASATGQVLIWRLSRDKRQSRIIKRLLTVRGDASNVVALSDDGQIVLSGGDARELRFWNVGSGRQLVLRRRHTSRITQVAFLPGRKLAISASAEGTHLWSVPDGRLVRSFSGRSCFAVGSGEVLALGNGRSVQVWHRLSR